LFYYLFASTDIFLVSSGGANRVVAGVLPSSLRLFKFDPVEFVGVALMLGETGTESKERYHTRIISCFNPNNVPAQRLRATSGLIQLQVAKSRDGVPGRLLSTDLIAAQVGAKPYSQS
jgi:hypothetical protein